MTSDEGVLQDVADRAAELATPAGVLVLLHDLFQSGDQTLVGAREGAVEVTAGPRTRPAPAVRPRSAP